MRSTLRAAFLHGVSCLCTTNRAAQLRLLNAHILSRERANPRYLAMSQRQTPTFLSANTAAEVDQRLMGDIGYSLDQLMEMAGHAVAVAIADFDDRLQKEPNSTSLTDAHVVVVCGPGNNGGDGLVCARHLTLMAYKVSVVCPKNKFPNLTKQLEAFCVPFLNEIPADAGLIVDGIFGFSFKGPSIREPFLSLIQSINNKKSSAKLVSIDVPSGWHVDEGNTGPDSAIDSPDVLVSLTAPKLCAKSLPKSCLHYVGGRFVPPSLCSDLRFELPKYPGSSPIVLL